MGISPLLVMASVATGRVSKSKCRNDRENGRVALLIKSHPCTAQCNAASHAPFSDFNQHICTYWGRLCPWVDGLILLGKLPDTQGIFPIRKIESVKPFGICLFITTAYSENEIIFLGIP